MIRRPGRGGRRLAPVLLAIAAAAYALAAWTVPPGFYDGFAPPAAYRFVDPPPQARATNLPPLPGSATIKVVAGVVQPGSAFTQDAQAQLAFVPGAFAAPAEGGPLTIEIQPQATFPVPPGTFILVTNVYRISANAKLEKEANLALTFSDQLPAPSTVYTTDEGGRWRSLPTNQSGSAFVISARVGQLGYFAAGYENSVPGAASNPRVGGGQWLPIAVALAILVVILAGIPLALVRRREAGSPPGPAPGPPGGGEPPLPATSRARPRRRPRRRT